MRTLLTKNEVADLLGVSPRTVEINSGKFVTTIADKPSRNGRPARLYHLSSLPGETQLRWAQRQREKVVEMLPAPPEAAPGQLALSLAVPAGPNLSPEDREQVEKRYAVIEPLVAKERFRLLWAQADGRKCKLIEILAQQHGTKARTIYHWLKAFKAAGLPGLVDKERSDKGRPRVLNNAALDFILAAALPRQGAYGELSIREIYRAYQEERAWRESHREQPLGESEVRKYVRYLDGSGRRLADSAQLPAASYETFRTWFDRIPAVVRVMAREGEEAFSNTQEILSFRDLAALKPLEYLVMDHRRLDIFCLIPKAGGGWQLGRPWLTAAIDMRTRKWLGWCIVAQPSSDSIAAVLKRAFLDHGLPVAVYWDNGKDFTCEWLEGKRRVMGDGCRVSELAPAWRGVLDMLGVRVHHAIVKRARSKIIEPNFLNIANFDRTLPWWCGHKPSARPERFDALVEQHEAWLRGERQDAPFARIEFVTALYDEFIQDLNNRPHSGEGMQKATPRGLGWMSPNECWDALIGQVERRAAPAEALQFCFAKRRRLAVRNGEVRASFGGRQFHYRLSGNPVALAALNGREVDFAYDPHDLGTAAVYCDDKFVGLVDSVELRRMGEEAFVADERDRRAMRREVKNFIAGVHRTVHVPTPEQRMQRRLAVRPAGMAEPARIEAPVALPAAVGAAVEAAREDRAFSFANAEPSGVELIRQAERDAYKDDDPDDETEFRFFQEG